MGKHYIGTACYSLGSMAGHSLLRSGTVHTAEGDEQVERKAWSSYLGIGPTLKEHLVVVVVRSARVDSILECF